VQRRRRFAACDVLLDQLRPPLHRGQGFAGREGVLGLVARRLVGFKANASALSTEELVRLDHPEGDDPESFAGGMWGIHEEFGLRILGGCCGTGDRYTRALATRMADASSA
jgi:homocysteine S-methyltransferase